MTTPALSTYGGVTAPRLVIPRDQDLSIAWSGGKTPDWFSFEITDYTGTYEAKDNLEGGTFMKLEQSHRRSLECLVPAALGTLTIPKFALSGFPSGSETTTAARKAGAPGREIEIGASSVRRGFAVAGPGREDVLVEAQVHSPLTGPHSQIQFEITFR